MNKSDLQTHATKVGLVPVDDMKMLRNRLLREFDKHISAYRTPKQTKSKKNFPKTRLKFLERVNNNIKSSHMSVKITNYGGSL